MCAPVMSVRFEKETTEAVFQLILDTDHVSRLDGALPCDSERTTI
jgi:hypothetical protein